MSCARSRSSDAAWYACALGEVWKPGRAVSWVIPWIAVAAEALPKTSPRSPVARCSRSSVSWCERNVVFHNVQVLLAWGRLSQSGRCLGKLPADRREPVDMAASHLSLIGRDSLIDLCCASSSLLMYSGTRGSSSHQPRVADRRETMSVALKPPLPLFSQAKKSHSRTLL